MVQLTDYLRVVKTPVMDGNQKHRTKRIGQFSNTVLGPLVTPTVCCFVSADIPVAELRPLTASFLCFFFLPPVYLVR